MMRKDFEFSFDENIELMKLNYSMNNVNRNRSHDPENPYFSNKKETLNKEDMFEE